MTLSRAVTQPAWIHGEQEYRKLQIHRASDCGSMGFPSTMSAAEAGALLGASHEDSGLQD